MPIDPEISLNIATPQFGAGANMGMIGQFAQVQNALNQNQLFQQTFAARQRAGQILSAAPSTEVGLQNLLQDPITAPFAGDVINSVRQGQLALAQTQKVQAETAQTQLGAAQSGLNAFLKALPAVAQDPSQWSGVVNANLATLPPDIARRVVPAMESIRKSLTDGLPEDPAAARAAFESRLGGFMVAGGVPHEAIRALYGTMAPQYQPVGPGGALAPVGGPMVPGGTPGGALGGGMPVGPSMTRQEEMKKVGAAGGAIVEDMANDQIELPGAIKRLDMMQDALSQFQAGPGAEAKARIAEMLSALGASPALVQGVTKMTPGSLAATQLFEAEVKPFAINMLKQSAQGTGRVMRSEVDQFLGMLSAAKTPEALASVLDQTRYGLQVGYDRSGRGLNTFQQLRAKGDPSVAGLDLANFPAWYNQHMDPRNLPQQTEGGLKLGPTSGQRQPVNPLAIPPGVTDLTPQIRQQHQQQLDKIWGQQ